MRIALEGEWDIARREELRTLLSDAVARATPEQVFVLDLREVTFVDSSALSIFLNTHRRLTRAGVKMGTVVRSGSIVLRAIEVTNLYETLNVLETETGADEQ